MSDADFLSRISWKASKLKKIQKSMSEEKSKGNIELKGRLVGVNAIFRGRLRQIEATELEVNPTYAMYDDPETIRYQLAFDAYNKLYQNLPGDSKGKYQPDMVIFTTLSDEEIEKKNKWEDLKKQSPYQKEFDSNVTFQGYHHHPLRTLLHKDDEKVLIPSVKLKMKEACKINFFGEENQWQTEENKCTHDFLKTISETLYKKFCDLTSKEKDGIELAVFCDFLHKENVSFYMIDPLFRIMDKNSNENNHNSSVCLLVNNDHIYPILNKDFIGLCHKKEIGDTLFSFGDIEIDYEKAEIQQSDNLDNEVFKLLEEKGQLASVVKFQSGHVSSIKFDERIILCNPNLDLVTTACKEFNIKFENQSLDRLCFEIMSKFTKMPNECQFTKDSLERFNQSMIQPYTHYYTADISTKNLEAIDICRFYTSLLHGKQDPWMFIDLDCDFQKGPVKEINMGFYRLSVDIDMFGKYVKIPAGTLISSNLLKYLVESGYCLLDHVSEYILSHRFIPGDYFKTTIEYLYKHHHDSPILKRIVNSFIGFLGHYRSKKSRGFITKEKSTAEAFAKTMEKATIKSFGNYFSVSEIEENIKRINYKPLWVQVICDSYIQLDKLISDVMADKTAILHAVKTDCIVVERIENAIPTKPMLPSINDIGKPFREDKIVYHYKEYCHAGSDYVKEYSTLKNGSVTELIAAKKGFAIWGGAGTGKTFLVNNEIIPMLKKMNFTYRILALSHLALQNYEEKTETLASFFLPGKKKPQLDYIIVDEFTMVSMFYYEQLFKLKSKFILVGDINQCLPVEKNVFCRYSQAGFIHELIDWNVINLTTVHRYDKKLYDESQKLISTGKCDLQQNNGAKALHICYTNAKCKEVNQLEHDKNKTNLVPYICVSNEGLYRNGDRLMFNKEENKWLAEKQPTKDKFVMAYCITTHKLQGQTVEENIVIHEAEKMNKNIIYTAMTRAKAYKNVFIEGKMRSEYKDEPLSKASDCSKFNKGAIYKLIKDEKVIYVGCVEKSEKLSQRIEQHIDKDFDSHQHEEYRYTNISELLQKETEEIQKEIANGSELTNKQKIAPKEKLPQDIFKFYSLEKAKERKHYTIHVYDDRTYVKYGREVIKTIKVTKTRTKEQAELEAQKFAGKL